VLLNQTLPDAKGTDVCRELRRLENTRSTPIIFLAANDSEIERVVAFELGSDDYVPKPLSTRELVLRVRAVLRRGALATVHAAASHEPHQERIRIAPEEHQPWADGRCLDLTVTEFRLLCALVQARGRVLSRSQLLDHAWDTTTKATERAVDTSIKRLREKLGEAGDCIETVRRLGYRMRARA
jgi:two-component system phosphate regulon response regulator PhoB